MSDNFSQGLNVRAARDYILPSWSHRVVLILVD